MEILIFNLNYWSSVGTSNNIRQDSGSQSATIILKGYLILTEQLDGYSPVFPSNWMDISSKF